MSKIKCTGCGKIIEIDVTKPVIVCSDCGKKFKNNKYDPNAAANNEQNAGASTESNNSESVDYGEKRRFSIACPACRNKIIFTAADPVIRCPECKKKYKNKIHQDPVLEDKEQEPSETQVEEQKPVETPILEQQPVVAPVDASEPEKPIEEEAQVAEEKPTEETPVEESKDEVIDDDFSLDDAFGSSSKFDSSDKEQQEEKEEDKEEAKEEPVAETPVEEQQKVAEETPVEPKEEVAEEKSESDDLDDLKDAIDSETESETTEESDENDEQDEPEIKVSKGPLIRIISGAILMILSLVTVGLSFYYAIDAKETFLALLKDQFFAMKDSFSADTFFTFISGVCTSANMMLVGKVAWILFACFALHLALGVKIKKGTTPQDVKRTKLVGYGFALAFSVLYLLVSVLQIYNLINPIVEGEEIKEAFKLFAINNLPYILLDAVSVGYFSYKIDFILNK